MSDDDTKVLATTGPIELPAPNGKPHRAPKEYPPVVIDRLLALVLAGGVTLVMLALIVGLIWLGVN